MEYHQRESAFGIINFKINFLKKINLQINLNINRLWRLRVWWFPVAGLLVVSALVLERAKPELHCRPSRLPGRHWSSADYKTTCPHQIILHLDPANPLQVAPNTLYTAFRCQPTSKWTQPQMFNGDTRTDFHPTYPDAQSNLSLSSNRMKRTGTQPKP